MNTLTSDIYANPDLSIDSDPMIKTIDMDSINDSVTTVDPIHVVAPVVAPVAAPVAKFENENENENEMDIIHKWRTAASDDVVPLIAMIRQLYFFSEFKKTMRTYTTHRNDIPKYIGKIKRRPALQIDVSDVDVHDHPKMYIMYCRLRAMIGMFRINEFMVRVEHAFDNTQIESEHFVVSKLMKIATKSYMVVGRGIDPIHHIVLPLQVQLRNIYDIPAHVRTLFHHISYSVQPVVFQSQTLDAWFNRANPTFEEIMRLCIQMAEALAYLHASDVVHGDIKPGNTLITPSQSLYLIDFGMSGIPGKGDATGGTKPFCAPETGNGGVNLSVPIDVYTWTKAQKHHDIWSFALMFFTLIVLHKPIFYPKDYPSDFFEVGYINPAYFDRIQDEPTRDLFRCALCLAKDRINAAEFLTVAVAIKFK
jgi:serine/threonine protein kinase